MTDLRPHEVRAIEAMARHYGDVKAAAAELCIQPGTLKTTIGRAKLRGHNWRDGVTVPGLTVAQSRVIRMYKDGMTYDEIGTALNITVGTVKSHLGVALRVLGVKREQPPKTLSDGQKRVLECMLDGMDNKEIAACLGIAPGTVKNVKANVLSFYNLPTQAKLQAYFYRMEKR